VTRLNAGGTGLIYSTYLGGASFDYISGIAVDGKGAAYVVGGTGSVDFPTTPGAVQARKHEMEDVFVTKLNTAGSALLYSTYLGGTGGETPFAIAIDGSGDAYVAGSTYSADFPTTPKAFDTTCGTGSECLTGHRDAFVAKIVER
jgi:hypothetical protein